MDENQGIKSEVEPLVEGVAAIAAGSPPPSEVSKDSPREISASTIGRMMGLATVSELKLLEGKIDLLSTKFTALGVKIDKIISSTANFPTGSDLERIDVQIGALKNLIKETLTGGKPEAAASSGAETPKKPRPNVFVSKSPDAPAPEVK